MSSTVITAATMPREVPAQSTAERVASVIATAYAGYVGTDEARNKAREGLKAATGLRDNAREAQLRMLANAARAERWSGDDVAAGLEKYKIQYCGADKAKRDPKRVATFSTMASQIRLVTSVACRDYVNRMLDAAQEAIDAEKRAVDKAPDASKGDVPTPVSSAFKNRYNAAMAALRAIKESKLGAKGIANGADFAAFAERYTGAKAIDATAIMKRLKAANEMLAALNNGIDLPLVNAAIKALGALKAEDFENAFAARKAAIDLDSAAASDDASDGASDDASDDTADDTNLLQKPRRSRSVWTAPRWTSSAGSPSRKP